MQNQSGPAQRRRRHRVAGQYAQLSPEAIYDISEYDSEDDTNVGDVVSDGIRHEYRYATWSQKSFTYDPKPQEFLGRRRTIQFFHHLPSIL
jgi:hypothetical protein